MLGWCCLDALGTLVRLEPPAPRLRVELARTTGVDVGAEAAERGFAAEIAYYLDNHMRGGDAAGLEALRDDCAGVLHEALGVDGLDRAAVRAAMLASIVFTAFPDAAPALRELRARGIGLVVVSNWDRSLPAALAQAGLGGLVDGVVSSAEVGQAKPAPEPFRAGLELAGVEAAERPVRRRLAGHRHRGRPGRGHSGAAGRARRAGAGRGGGGCVAGEPCPPYSERGWRPWHPPSRRPIRPSCPRARSAGRPGRPCSRCGASWSAWARPGGRHLLAGIVVAFGGEADGTAVTVLGTIAQGFCFAGAAWFFASRVAKPRLWHFGLQGGRFWPRWAGPPWAR